MSENRPPNIDLVYYSPTGSTKKNLDALVRGLGGIKNQEINLTKPTNRDRKEYPLGGEVVVIALPIYSSTIPHVVLNSLHNLRGDGKWAILLSTYGNVKNGTWAANLANVLLPNGFKILAVAHGLGEHSFCCSEVPLAQKRPDFDDLMKMEEYGRQIRKKYDENPTPLSIEPQEVPPLKPRPTFVELPKVNETKCTKCRACIYVCPVNAINSDSLQIDEDKCTLCCACVKVCQEKARAIIFDTTPEKFENFFAYTKQRLESQLIL